MKLLRIDERHGPLRQRGKRQRWIHSGIGRHRRAVDYIETVVAEDAVMIVDHAPLRRRGHVGATEDVGCGGRAEKAFAEEAAGEAVDLLLMRLASSVASGIAALGAGP